MLGSRAAERDTIVYNMSSCDGALCVDVVKKAESLVCFRGTHPATDRRRGAIALLISSRWQPKIHSYVMFDIKGASRDAAALETMLEVLPFVASTQVAHSRMSNCCASIYVTSSEEVAHEMALTQHVMEDRPAAMVSTRWRFVICGPCCDECRKCV